MNQNHMDGWMGGWNSGWMWVIGVLVVVQEVVGVRVRTILMRRYTQPRNGSAR